MMEKKRTYSGPFITPNCKHSIYAKGWLSLSGSPVSVRLGGGAAHIPFVPLSPFVQEPERASNQRAGLGDERPMRTFACRDAVSDDGPHAQGRLIPCVSSEVSGSPALRANQGGTGPYQPPCRVSACRTQPEPA